MRQILTLLINNRTLSRRQARELMSRITAGECQDMQIAAVLALLQMRGPDMDELIGFREALLERRVPVNLDEFDPVDIVGTGGDGKNTFNISTCSCFVVGGAGYKVAKHGNYGATSVSGASNVLETLGARFTTDSDTLRRSIERSNVAYMHAPLFNSGMRYAAPARKALGVRTVFNLLGPLVNPAMPRRQLLGVADLRQMRLYANTLRALGREFAVVTSLDGYDEISLTGKFKIITNEYEMVRAPRDLDLPRISPGDIYGGKTPAEAAEIFTGVLSGSSTVAQRECVVVNAAAAIQVSDPGKGLDECIAMARESILSGRALRSLHNFLDVNR